MPPDPNIPDDLNKLDRSEEKMRSTTGKEWLLVYAAIFVFIVIVALTAYHLTHG
jgi:hypothetical protein